jgi:hypothetical protein
MRVLSQRKPWMTDPIFYCSQCSIPMALATIEPSKDEGIDVRLFCCYACQKELAVRVKFR